MISTLIIEDEEPAAQRLEKLLKEIDPQIVVLDILDSVSTAKKWFMENAHPDLVMLDIQLADGLSFDIFRHIEVKSFVIFTTAYDDYAIKAFELNSIDYLLKPIDKSKLAKSLHKFKSLKYRDISVNITELIATMEGNKTWFKKRFAISIGNKIRSIEIKGIGCFYSMEKNTFLTTFSGSSYPVDFSLDKLESLLDPDVFFRVNRQFIVNYSAIEKINILSKSRIEIKVTGQTQGILISTAKTHSFRIWLDK